MPIIEHNYFPRADFNSKDWNHKDTPSLGVYDSFDKLDHTITEYKNALHGLQWIVKPVLENEIPKVAQKYRVTIDCKGFEPDSIKTEIKGKKIIVTGHEEENHDQDGDFLLRQFKRSYDLPEHCEIEKLVSFIVNPCTLVIEVPLKEQLLHMDVDLVPKIKSNEHGEEMVNLEFAIPENIDPENIHVHIKDNDFILKAEDKSKKPDGMSKYHYFKQSKLPENTKYEDLKCSWKDHQLSCHAPLNPKFESHYKDHQRKPWNTERPVFHARKYDFDTHHPSHF